MIMPHLPNAVGKDTQVLGREHTGFETWWKQGDISHLHSVKGKISVIVYIQVNQPPTRSKA